MKKQTFFKNMGIFTHTMFSTIKTPLTGKPEAANTAHVAGNQIIFSEGKNGLNVVCKTLLNNTFMVA